jgi:hypothetical protein
LPNKHLIKYSAPLAIKDMQVQSTLRFYLTPGRLAIIKSTTKRKCCWGCKGKKETLSLLMAMWTIAITMEISIQAYLIIPPYYSWAYTLKSIKQIQERYLQTHVYCSSLHNSQTMERAKVPKTDVWIKKMWGIISWELPWPWRQYSHVTLFYLNKLFRIHTLKK